MKIKNVISLFAILFIVTISKAQQLPLYTQYMLNDYVMNPAIGGKNPYFEAMSDNRYQWIGITDAPRTYSLSVHGPTKNLKVGLGGYLFTDIVGPTRRIGVNGTYAYHVKLNDKMKLSLGLSAGLLQFAVDGSKITLHDPVDLIISSGYQSVLLPDFGAGFYLYTDKWYIGSALPQIYAAKIKFFDYDTDPLSKLATHSYSSAGYRFDIGDDFKIEPSLLVKYVKPAPVQFDLGVKATYRQKFWLGGTFRTRDAVCAFAGFVYQENILIGYSYDFSTTNIKNYSSGTHELVIAIRFAYRKAPNAQSRIE